MRNDRFKNFNRQRDIAPTALIPSPAAGHALIGSQNNDEVRPKRGRMLRRTLDAAPSEKSAGGKSMASTSMAAAATISLIALSPAAFAQQYGTPDEAKAMLMKAVAAVKADEAEALDIFNKGEGGFRDRDLYVFCNTISDGKGVAPSPFNAAL